MKTRPLALIATVAATLLAVACSGPQPTDPAPPENVMFWEGYSCPITGNIYADAGENGAMQGNVPLQFEHEGQQYEAYVWDESAVDEFAKNRDLYITTIIADSK